MPLDAYNIVRPNQINQAGDIDALNIEEYTGIVEGTIARKSALNGFVQIRPVKGTNTLTNYAVGEATLQKLTPGQTPDGTGVDFNKASLTVDTVVIARNILPILEVFQNNFDARSQVGMEQGKKIAKFHDQAFFIQAAKAAQLANSVYNGTDGHLGGNVETFAGATDNKDPVKLYAKIAALLEKMELKDVDVIGDDLALFLSPTEYYALAQSEHVISGEYITSDGNTIKGKILQTFGVPVRVTNNLKVGNVSGHLLSNAGNSNAYDGNFSKLCGLVFSQRALLAGETIPLQSKVWFDDMSKHWMIDSWLSFGVTPNRAEYAGCLLLP